MDDDAWIRGVLDRAPFGQLATVYDGQPFIHSNSFVYDGEAHAIYLHTAREGRTRDCVVANDRVCFSVSEMGRLLPAKVAMEFSVEYAGVVAFGRCRVVTDKAESLRALQCLLDKYFPHLRPGADYRETTDRELALTTVYRVDIVRWSGKKKAAADDFPGAFVYPYSPD